MGAALATAGVLAGAGAVAAASPPDVYRERCAQCHTSGAGGAPRLGDAPEWTRRIRTGLNPLYRNAIEGMPNTAMAAKGGHRDLPDATVRAAVDHLLAESALPATVVEAARRYDALGVTDADFLRMDANLDGHLSAAEVAADPAIARVFGRYDADRDGRLSESEYLRLEAALLQERRSVQVGDAELAARARAALETVRELPVRSLKIEAQAGVVTLVGVVEEAELARRAGLALRRLPGLQRLDNRLVPGSLLEFD